MPERLSDKKVKEILNKYYEDNKTFDQIAKESKVSKGVISKYVQEAEQERIDQVERAKKEKQNIQQQAAVQPVQQPQQAQPVQQVQLKPAKPMMLPYPEIQEPSEWLKEFLSNYKLRPQFIVALCNRSERRNELPHPSDLMADIQQADSGQTNARTISYIVEDYEYELKKYLDERARVEQATIRRRRQGYPTRTPYNQESQYRDRFGYDVQRQDQLDPQRRGIPFQQYRERYDDPFYHSQPPQQYGNRSPYPVQQTPYPALESELERFIKLQGLLTKTEEKTPALERYEKDNQDLKTRIEKMEEERQREILDELNSTRHQYQQENMKRKELEEKLRKLEFQQSQKSLSETDLRYEELKDKHSLELKKLEEKGKNREAIANAVKTGFSSIGQAIFRTAQESGTDDQHEMAGYTDGKGMWQAPCPYCQTPITAPLSADRVICPGCNRQLETTTEEPVEEIIETTPQLQQQTRKPLKPSPPPSANVDEQKQTEMNIAECPYCNKPMSIPPDVNLVECPHCNKRLEISPKKEEITETTETMGQQEIQQENTNIIEEKQSQANFTVEQETLSTSDLPDWREQVKEPKKKSTIRKLEEKEIEQPIVNEEFEGSEKEKIDQSLKEAKEGKIIPMEIKEENNRQYRPPEQESAHHLNVRIDKEIETKENNDLSQKEPFKKDGFTLFKVLSKVGKPFYYFAHKSEKGEPCYELPTGYELGKNKRNGMPFLKKIKG